MASSENLASLEPWIPRLPFADSWFSDAFARDTETLTKALQKSLSGVPEPLPMASNNLSSFFDLKPETQTPTVSGVSGSDPETAPKRRVPGGAIACATSGKIAKRKSRATKRTHTTFITADPANFRQMVQQVTGVRFSNGQLPVPPVLKPEPQRLGNRLQGYLPTLDTSAFLLDHHHHHHQVLSPAATSQSPLSFEPAVVIDGGAAAAAALDFDGFGSFPTLESWKVM
ncbi:calmodulin-binding protein 25-like [Malania oleifera]|uniref:calmodulin-binding protein 25-like n=1 Tax=Malania oleifera TaxID=397392 RepID=UPI0025AE43B2|nr:calmodulin-binding protein 25-like [Malania oleifera]